MVFHVVRSYRLRNIFINRSILQAKEVNYRLESRRERSAYLAKKNKIKKKRLRRF